MKKMFYNTNIRTIYVSNKWNTSNVTDSTKMFAYEEEGIDDDAPKGVYAGVNPPVLTGGNGTKWDANYIDKTYARIDAAEYGGSGNYVSGDKGYFTRAETE